MLIRRELNTQEQLEETVKARTQELESSLNVITETNLELRKAKEAAEKASAALNMSELRLKDSQRIARLGQWELHIANNKLAWSDEA